MNNKNINTEICDNYINIEYFLYMISNNQDKVNITQVRRRSTSYSNRNNSNSKFKKPLES